MIIRPVPDRGSLLAAARQQYVHEQQTKAMVNGKPVPLVSQPLPPDDELIASNPEISEELSIVDAQPTQIVKANNSDGSSGIASSTSGEVSTPHAHGTVVNVLG